MAKFTKSSEDSIEMTTENGGNFPVELSICKEKKERVSKLLDEMSKLTNVEKIYMHLKLPPCPIVENEKKSDSPPSGSAYRTSSTLNWIQSHYIEDRRVCLSKQEVYSHYKLYCDTHGINPFAMTEFGKVVKTAFPSVHDRRLGQRGKSKYFYGGLRRKSTNGDTSDQESNKIEDPQPFDHDDELESLSSQLVCEWASYLLGKNFSSVKSLAQYLVFSGASCGKKAALFNMLLDMDGWGSSGATSDKRNAESLLQDTQALIQRKILQKEVLKEHKSLVKQQEIHQKDTQAAYPTAARLAVLSPSLHALHSSDASSCHPSRVHVLNVQRNNSASSMPIVPLRQEMVEVPQQASNVKSASVCADGYTRITESNSKLCSNQSKSSCINKNIPNSNIEAHIDKAEIKTKQSKLVSSKSLEESNQRQSKRNSDFLHNTNQGRNSKRRRCITSLGMAGLKEQSSESIEQDSECHKEGAVIRPVSCPVFNDQNQTFICDMESEDIPASSNLEISETTKAINDIPDVNISSSGNDDQTSKPENSSSSFHFVRKPTVISIKPPEIKENNEPISFNTNNNVCDSNNGHASTVKKSHRIMSSILSSSDSNIPHHFSSSTNKLSSLALPSYGDFQMTDNLCENIKDSDKSIRREAHTLDNAYLLPCQSSRSAFVRVMNGKGHNRNEIIPRPRHSSFDESFYNGHSKHEKNKLTEAKEATQISILSKESSPVIVTEGIKQCPNDGFKSIAITSSIDRVPSTVLDISTSIRSNTSDTLQSTSVHLSSPVNSKRMTNKSPVTPPKRHQSRSRFTPIRPKMIGCCNLSPQKLDMRPVATILKEQRARSAQELLVNLASSYQGGVKVQLSSDLLGQPTDKTINPISSVLCPLANQNSSCPTAVILEPISLSNPITTQASPLISPQKLISSASDIKIIPSVSSTLSNLLTSGPRISAMTSIGSSPNHQSDLIPSSSVVSSVQSLESPIIVADAKGVMYSLGNADAGKSLPKVSSLQQLLQGSTDKIHPLSTPLQQNMVNVSNIKGHVVGPDVNGQTFLLVPNSEPSTLPHNHAPFPTPKTSLMDTSSSPKQRHSLISKLNRNSGVSSAALLSELSQLASISNDSKTKQPVIKHDSTISAFQKCEPNKSITDINTDSNYKTKNRKGEIALMPSGKGESSDCESVICDEVFDGHDLSGDACLRKRKASKSQDDKSNEKKRHNIDNTGMDDVVFVKSDAQTLCKEEKGETTREDRLLISKTSNENSLLTHHERIGVSDTEALLKLINSKSMTVKQTVMAMNSLKAQMKKSGLSIPTVKTGEIDLSVKSEKMENTIQDTGISEKSAQKISHVIRRNTSLNLESLESDALLDTELSLDHHLVEDMNHLKNGKSGHKTSVAVAAKSHHLRSADKQKDHMRKSKDCNQLPTISPKALHSYQMILSEQNKLQKDKNSDKEVLKALTEVKSKVQCQKEEQKGQRRGQRRCVSSVQDILQNRSRPLPPAFGYQNTKSQSEVDAFDALLSKIHSNQLSTHKDNAVRSHSSLVQESELPVDIVDFVTESMSSRRDRLDGSSVLSELNKAKGTSSGISNFESFKPQESIGTRSISVPNTKPDFIDVGQSHSSLTTSVFPNRSSLRTEPTQLFLQPTIGDHMINTEEAGTSTTKTVFLSPIGPAKLARRSSVEKSISQGQMDRSVTRMPTEMSSPNSMPQSTLNKERFTTDSCFNSSSKIQVNERHLRSKTPVDRTLMSSEKHRSQTPIMQPVDKGYKSPVSRALAKTPVEKYFVKQSNDLLASRSDLMLPTLSSVRREDTSSVHTFVSDGGYSSGSVSQTPNSDSGHSSVSQTPISDFGYSSVSPSPVMMSSATFPGECGRNISPATIFMPLRSDSALSLNNHRSESPTSVTQSNHMELISGFPNNSENHNAGTNGVNGAPTQKGQKCEWQNLPQFTSEFSSSLLKSLSSTTLLLNDMEGNEDSKSIKSSSNTKTLLKLLTSSIQNIPTPPVSPSNSPPNTISLPFSIPSPQLPYPGTSPLTLALSTAPCFMPGSSSLTTSSSHIQQGHQFRPSPHFRSQDLPSPALVNHNYPSSPQIVARPPSSPHQYSSHPSPPFTPCSLRSLPSPRCMTPISHKYLMSPRSVTPSSDPGQAAPNRFMPIQSSGVLPTSQTTTHTYIQPIRPVVALASACSGHNTNSNNTNAISTHGPQSFIDRLPIHPITPISINNSGTTHSVQSIPSMSSQLISSPKPHRQGIDGTDAIRTSEHKPLEANSVLVLSLSGDIGPLSNQGVDSAWGSAESSEQAPPKHTPSSGKLPDLMIPSEDVNKLKLSQSSQKSLVFKSQSSSTLPHTPPQHSKPRDHSSSSSILKLPKGQPNSNFSNDDSRSVIDKRSYSSRAFKPPLTISSSSPSSLSSSSPVRSFKPVPISSSTVHHDFATIGSRLSLSQPSGTIMQTPQDVQNGLVQNRRSNSIQLGHYQSSKSPQNSNNHTLLNHTNTTVSNAQTGSVNSLHPTTQDELQATLDVLKDMDGQYFL